MAQRSQSNMKENQHKGEDDIFFNMLSAANNSGEEGISVDHLLSHNYSTTRRQLEKYIDEIVNTGLYSYDELTKRYKITKRGLYFLKLYAVRGMEFF